MNNEPRERLIKLLNSYLSKPHVLMKRPMRFYLNRLETGQNLKTSHIRSLLPFLRWNLSPMTDKQIMEYFFELTRPTRTPPQPSNTLEHFFEG